MAFAIMADNFSDKLTDNNCIKPYKYGCYLSIPLQKIVKYCLNTDAYRILLMLAGFSQQP
jgi:hypothetical protein